MPLVITEFSLRLMPHIYNFSLKMTLLKAQNSVVSTGECHEMGTNFEIITSSGKQY